MCERAAKTKMGVSGERRVHNAQHAPIDVMLTMRKASGVPPFPSGSVSTVLLHVSVPPP